MSSRFGPQGASIAQKLQAAYQQRQAMQMQALQQQTMQSELEKAAQAQQIRARMQQLAPAILAGDAAATQEGGITDAATLSQLLQSRSSMQRLQMAQELHPDKVRLGDAQADKAVEDARFAPQLHQAAIADRLAGVNSKNASAALSHFQRRRGETLLPLEKDQIAANTYQSVASGNLSSANTVKAQQEARGGARTEINDAIAFGEAYLNDKNNDPSQLGAVMASRFGPEVAADPVVAQSLAGLAAPAVPGGPAAVNPFAAPAAAAREISPQSKEIAKQGALKQQANDIKRIDTLRGAAEGADTALAKIRRFRELQASGINTGPAAGRVPAIGPVAAEMDALSTGMRIEVSEALKGSITDREQAMLARAAPGRVVPEDANENMLAMREAALLRPGARRDFEEAWLEQHGNLTGAGKAWDKFIKENPVLQTDDSGNVSVIRDNASAWQEYLDPTYTKPKEAAKPGGGDILKMYGLE